MVIWSSYQIDEEQHTLLCLCLGYATKRNQRKPEFVPLQIVMHQRDYGAPEEHKQWDKSIQRVDINKWQRLLIYSLVELISWIVEFGDSSMANFALW